MKVITILLCNVYMENVFVIPLILHWLVLLVTHVLIKRKNYNVTLSLLIKSSDVEDVSVIRYNNIILLSDL